jgi:bifunctional non-homologous end joining protein LigD
MANQDLNINGQIVKITNPDRILFGKSGVTKSEMIEYYQRIAPIMLPHVKNRPLSMQRFPDGINAEGFYQKDASEYFPAWIKRFNVEREDKAKVVHHVLCNDAQTLVYLANQAVITPHIWLSTAKKIHNPDLMIFDLDPAKGATFADVMYMAKRCKKFLETLELPSFVKTTGSRGLHVTVPIKPEKDFDYVHSVAHSIAQALVQENPEYATLEMRLNKREGKVFIDYLRNTWAQTAVAPYALRAREGAPVATPIEWRELTSTMEPQKYTIKNIFRRIARKGDPWQDMYEHAVSLKSIKL